jgi:hypothetical protein
MLHKAFDNNLSIKALFNNEAKANKDVATMKKEKFLHEIK